MLAWEANALPLGYSRISSHGILPHFSRKTKTR
jgi:hypothetical protein